MISLAPNPQPTTSLTQMRGLTHFPTEFGSADLRLLSSQMRRRMLFAARTTNADFLQELDSVLDDMLSGKINQATGRWRLMKKLAELGYDPAVGFPQDFANVPPAERGSLQDISSRRRLDLMLETNQRQIANYGRMVDGNRPAQLEMFPAWEFVRLYHREVPRGSEESRTVGWDVRWIEAGDSVNWHGAIKSPMVALKSSPIWQALGDGINGKYHDSLGQPYPPFAFSSGWGWLATARARCVELGLISAATAVAPMRAELAPGVADWQRALRNLGPDFKAQLLADLDAERAAAREEAAA